MASKRRLRRKACTNKRRYASVEEAEYDRKALQRKTGVIFNAYYCPHCGGVHVGHAPMSISKRSERASCTP